MVTGDFLGQSMMRKAWVLMDLHRYEEAKQALEEDVLKACLGQFAMPVLYEYFFSYGNTLGSLGDIAGMDDALTRAMAIAAEELGEYPRVAQCWRNLFEHATRAQAWDYLARECPSCVTLAERCGDEDLAELARATQQRALQQLG